jgi:hypothetical protein
MDACTYESITGLKNYYGFKSLLKNGGWTQRYSCDDDTIVFNRIESFTFFAGGFSLAPNQVGVVLNISNQAITIAPGVWLKDAIFAFDVDNSSMILQDDANVIGTIITNSFSNALGNERHMIVLAIFDLY